MTYKNVPEIFAGKIRLLREQRGLTRDQLAIAMGWKIWTIQHLESGYIKPSVEHLVAYANYFGVSATFLLTDSQPYQYGLMYPTVVRDKDGVRQPLNYRRQVGENVKRLLKKKGLSPDRLLSELRWRGLHSMKDPYNYFYRLTTGKVSITVELLAACATELEVSIEELLWSPESETVYSKEVVAPYIRLLRDELGWTQSQLAEQVSSLGVRMYKSYISPIETGQISLRVTPFMAFTVKLGTTVGALLTPSWQQYGELVTPFPPKWEAPQTTESKRGGYTSTEVYYDRQVGQYFECLREKHGMSQLQLAEELKNRGRSANRFKVSRIENGEYHPSTHGGFTGVTVDFTMAVAAVFAEREGVPPVKFAETLLTRRSRKKKG